MKEKKRALLAGLVWVVLLICLDQWTKYLAKIYLEGNAGMSLIPGVFELFYLENTGAALGMFNNMQWFFVLIALVMTIAACIIYMRLPGDRHYIPLRFICILIAAGAAGNMIDRIRFRYVIDFLYFSLINFPVFNIADCYVVLGAVLTVILSFTLYRKDSFDFLFPGKS